MNLYGLLLILFAVSLLMCTPGFKKYVYFMSLGYGFAVAGIGVTLIAYLLTGAADPALWNFVFPILFIVYGFRLSGFLAIREIKNTSYRKTLSEVAGGDDKMKLGVKLIIWIGCALLYVAQTSPVFFRAYNHKAESAFLFAGITVSVIGVVLESIADKQKSKQKAANPDMVACKGLYKIVRCPNYFGEILFWTGVFVSGIDALNTAGQWAGAIFGYACIVMVMFNGAQRLEKRQMKRYGDNKEYNDYADKTPIIIPLIPLYHLNRKV